ncbi:predicted protein [Pyrenophora tritici-repentis Pt-1C-BFP]|uniref:Uncharacterized protein n=1 Tax=Pyrenophora tritici-repentis (strain Pt-1C-BFP) TaxID=426418 RepID=B2WN71_PYRTR|nr:uncharacterized protein PTRG_11520 [Pyrenophora tritici-repentis Pt-1C-BFP]EDU44570.1 predicted protein [Pyrenophora tritici-repentis Pt-1C-BFP]
MSEIDDDLYWTWAVTMIAPGHYRNPSRLPRDDDDGILAGFKPANCQVAVCTARYDY